MSTELLITKVSKEFPGVLALNEVNLTLTSGTVHALLGENGAPGLDVEMEQFVRMLKGEK